MAARRACGFFPKRKKEKPQEAGEVSWKPEVSEIAAAPISKESKKGRSYFIRKVYETDPLTCPKCQGDLSVVAHAGMGIISFIDLSLHLPVAARAGMRRQAPRLRKCLSLPQKPAPKLT